MAPQRKADLDQINAALDRLVEEMPGGVLKYIGPPIMRSGPEFARNSAWRRSMAFRAVEARGDKAQLVDRIYWAWEWLERELQREVVMEQLLWWGGPTPEDRPEIVGGRFNLKDSDGVLCGETFNEDVNEIMLAKRLKLDHPQWVLPFAATADIIDEAHWQERYGK